MKLLFDENISFRIINHIHAHFPDSIHVSSIWKKRFSDLDIWMHAKENNYTIVTFDSDFYEWQQIRGFPPKIIWLRMGNSQTELIANKLIRNVDQIRNFTSETEIGLLEIH